MKNQFTEALQNAFDVYFQKKHGMIEVKRAVYEEEMEKFARFLVQEYEESIKTGSYWEARFWE